MISTILFDMNDVLYSYDRSVRVARIARICCEPAAAVAEAIWESGFEASSDRGVMDADAYLSGFGERLGCPLTQDEWTEALRAAVTPIAETLTPYCISSSTGPGRRPHEQQSVGQAQPRRRRGADGTQ
jgi:glucose-1-phosphatase